MFVLFFVSLFATNRSRLYDTHSGASILGPALLDGIVGDGVFFSEPFGCQTVSWNALVDQLSYNTVGPLLGEPKIRVSGTHIVCIARDLQVDARAIRKHCRDVIQLSLRFRPECCRS
jgi:hypothetical protein